MTVIAPIEDHATRQALLELQRKINSLEKRIPRIVAQNTIQVNPTVVGGDIVVSAVEPVVRAGTAALWWRDTGTTAMELMIWFKEPVTGAWKWYFSGIKSK